MPPQRATPQWTYINALSCRFFALFFQICCGLRHSAVGHRPAPNFRHNCLPSVCFPASFFDSSPLQTRPKGIFFFLCSWCGSRRKQPFFRASCECGREKSQGPLFRDPCRDHGTEPVLILGLDASTMDLYFFACGGSSGDLISTFRLFFDASFVLIK